VDTNPASVIFLDNKNIGRAPFQDKVTAGSYTMKLVPDSTTTQLASWEGNVVVGPNLLTYVNADLNESDLSSALMFCGLKKYPAKNQNYRSRPIRTALACCWMMSRGA